MARFRWFGRAGNDAAAEQPNDDLNVSEVNSAPGEPHASNLVDNENVPEWELQFVRSGAAADLDGDGPTNLMTPAAQGLMHDGETLSFKEALLRAVPDDLADELEIVADDDWETPVV